MGMLRQIAKILPFFIIKGSYKKLSGEAWWEVCYILKKRNEDWRAFWLDEETILLIRKERDGRGSEDSCS